ncbi:MAG: PilZ domain-containing protein [Spirochaetales bacterium]|nr:PilZ domain-containing protein [Spirochaetales bacterium]
MRERRRFRRLELDVLVNFSEKARARAKNISLLGICIITNIPFHAGVYLNLLITLPDTTTIETLGRVIWQRKIKPDEYENGIEFYNINPNEKNKLDDFIRGYNAEKGNGSSC